MNIRVTRVDRDALWGLYGGGESDERRYEVNASAPVEIDSNPAKLSEVRTGDLATLSGQPAVSVKVQRSKP